MLAGDTTALPVAGREPFQPPLATQVVALVDDQVSVDDVPAMMAAGVADNDTVGSGVGGGGGGGGGATAIEAVPLPLPATFVHVST